MAFIEEAFNTFDLNKDGLISFPEFLRLLKSMGIGGDGDVLLNKCVVGEWDRWDADGNGTVDFNEFVRAVTGILTNCQDDDVIKKAFRMFDKDNDGYITLDELAVTMSDLGHTDLTPSQLLDMMREADLDKDGKISFVEFKILLKT